MEFNKLCVGNDPDVVVLSASSPNSGFILVSTEESCREIAEASAKNDVIVHVIRLYEMSAEEIARIRANNCIIYKVEELLSMVMPHVRADTITIGNAPVIRAYVANPGNIMVGDEKNEDKQSC